MKTFVSVFKKLSLFSIITLITYSCSDDEGLMDKEALTQTELKTILESDDISGVADTVLSELYMNNGSTDKSAKNNDCYSADYSDTGFIATFNNCVLNGTDNVNGTVTVAYNLESETASYTASYTDFYVGTIKINGTRTYVLSGNSNENSVSFSVTSTMSLEMEDGETISENGTKTFTITFGDSLETSTLTIDGNWTLNVNNDTYTVNVNNTLEGNFSCAYLTTGVMTVNKNGLKVTVNFGDGSCDDLATLIYPNGVEEEISLKD
jgi:hypothetical protein